MSKQNNKLIKQNINSNYWLLATNTIYWLLVNETLKYKYNKKINIILKILTNKNNNNKIDFVLLFSFIVNIIIS